MTISGKPFRVIDAEPYPPSKVSFNYKTILEYDSGFLIAIKFRGTFIPNITLDAAVARLKKVEIGRKILDRPGIISKALGIKNEMIPYKITEVKEK